MRKNIVAGNWKMNKNLCKKVLLWQKELNEVLTADKNQCDVIIHPFIHLPR